MRANNWVVVLNTEFDRSFVWKVAARGNRVMVTAERDPRNGDVQYVARWCSVWANGREVQAN